MSKNSSKNKRGFVALTSVILINAVLLFVVSSISFQTIDEGQVTTAHEQSLKSRYVANACAEYALMQIANDSESIATDAEVDSDELDGNNCTYSISGNYPNKTIEITSSVGQNNFTSKIQIVVTTTIPFIEIASWNNFSTDF
ncbi:MAG TPA: hypothetical protein PKA60_00050 [Candidatus Paceibacterota bacterium]|nr:hypothetical protein [Candidatus Paceibacterota bacterium]